MAQTTTKSVAAKKAAALPKTVPATKKASAAKPAAAKPAKKPASTKSASAIDTAKTPAKKTTPRATTAKSKGNGEIVTEKKSKKAGGLMGGVTPEQRYRMICDAAYYRAERRGFIGGDPAQDWIDAELEIDQLLCGSESQQPGH